MIERLWVKNFRMLAANRIDMSRFSVLVGRNASGKTTLMMALRLISSVMQDGVAHALEEALDGASANFDDLCFHLGRPLEFALQIRLNEGLFRYELELGAEPGGREIVVLRENLFSLQDEPPSIQPSLFGDSEEVSVVVHSQAPKGYRKVVGKTADGKDYFRDEKTDWNNMFRFGPNRSALGNIPEDTDRFPGAIAVRNFLRDGIMMVELDSKRLRDPSSPRTPTTLLRDGSNLAAAAHALNAIDKVAYASWVAHVASAIEGLDTVTTWVRPEDKHVVLQATFKGDHGTPVPSWLLSDGTLRLLALSLLAYAESPSSAGMMLVEEPENGLHPLAIQAAYDALSGMRFRQVLVATHSPVFLAKATLREALVFHRSTMGTTELLRGNELAEVREWQERVQLAKLFATGVL